MRSFCEVIATDVLPSVRSIITRELLVNHSLTQKEVGELLGITQFAVSQYMKEARGTKVRILEKNPEIMRLINKLTDDLINQYTEQKTIGSHVCSICRKVREDKIIEQLQHMNYECILQL